MAATDPQEEELLAESEALTQDASDEGAPGSTPTEPMTIEEELEAAIREREEYKERWQRAAADYQNLKRRQLADIEAAVRRAQTPLLEDALIVLDYLDMALSTQVTEPEAKNLMVGVEMTRQQFLGVLERQEIVQIDTQGTFDPALHQAVATVETDEVEAGTILETTRSGWTYRGQVLRAAQVKVATRPSEEEAGAEASQDASAEA